MSDEFQVVYEEVEKCGKKNCCHPTLIKLACGCTLRRRKYMVFGKSLSPEDEKRYWGLKH